MSICTVYILYIVLLEFEYLQYTVLYMLGVLAIHRCFWGSWMIYVKLSSFEI